MEKNAPFVPLTSFPYRLYNGDKSII